MEVVGVLPEECGPSVRVLFCDTRYVGVGGQPGEAASLRITALPVPMAQTLRGEGLNTRSTTTSSSNTPSPTPSYPSSNASDLQQQLLTGK